MHRKSDANADLVKDGTTENDGGVRGVPHRLIANLTAAAFAAHSAPHAIAVEAASPVPTEECHDRLTSLLWWENEDETTPAMCGRRVRAAAADEARAPGSTGSALS